MSVEKKRLAINISAQMVSFLVQVLISFVLTPFVVSSLGVEAFGFIGLADNFVMYAQLLVIALNSMATRFVSIAYYKNDMDEVNKFASSVFFSNLIIAIVIFVVSIIFVYYIDDILVIPSNLIWDVKLLFFLMFLNFELSILFSIYQVATFIKNRLELNSIRNIVSSILKASFLLFAFSLFKPNLYYVGIATILSSIYIAFVNKRYTGELTPEIRMSFELFEYSKVKILVSSGSWNALVKLASLLGENFDLLLANLCISAVAMGNLSVAKKIPVLFFSFVSTICMAFWPQLTKSFAKDNFSELKEQLLFSIKLVGCLALIPLCLIFSISDIFYNLWVPELDSHYLYTITSIFSLPLILGAALEPVQYIFVVTNKVKYYSFASVLFNTMNFITLLIIVNITSGSYTLYYMIGCISFWAFWRIGLFLPMYSAYCIKEKKTMFYKPIIKLLIAFVFSVTMSILLKKYLLCYSTWLNLFLFSILVVLICLFFSWFIILDFKLRNQLILLLKNRIHKNWNNV